MAKRRFLINYAGACTNTSDRLHDCKMSVNYGYLFGDVNKAINSIYLRTGKTTYENIGSLKFNSGIAFNYTTDVSRGYSLSAGMAINVSVNNSVRYSIYRREYNIYKKPGNEIVGWFDPSADGGNGAFYYIDNNNNRKQVKYIPNSNYIYIDANTNCAYMYKNNKYQLTTIYKEYKGLWEPVIVNNTNKYFRDYNITNGRSYQYIIYPGTDENSLYDPETQQMFANATGSVLKTVAGYSGQYYITSGTLSTGYLSGQPIQTHWNEWSLCELVPVDNNIDIPSIKQSYKVNNDQIWLFKYSLDTGSQTQNISRNEIQTLGQYPKMGFGKLNYDSGEVTALLGSEIIPYSRYQYIERRQEARNRPLTTNEKTAMLQQWKKLVGSKNPKLLKDIKGQSWIVQIIGGSNKVQNFYLNQPDTISFQWKQIGDPKEAIIYGDAEIPTVQTEDIADWKTIF